MNDCNCGAQDKPCHDPHSKDCDVYKPSHDQNGNPLDMATAIDDAHCDALAEEMDAIEDANRQFQSGQYDDDIRRMMIDFAFDPSDD